jgi:phosphoglycerate dehydrogenase-like enzyme
MSLKSSKETYRLAILSRDATEYAKLIQRAELAGLEIVFASDSADTLSHSENIDIVLGEPHLVLQCPHIHQKLTWVQSTWAGVTPLICKQRPNYLLTGVKDIFGQQMREYVFAYLLYFSRQIESFKVKQSQQSWQLPKLDHLFGKTLGIMGVGSIGKEIARTAKGFDMRVLGITRTHKHNDNIEQQFTTDNCIEFAKQCDYIVSVLPDTPQTKHLINTTFLEAMQSHSVLINVGRSQVIDNQALITSLKNRQIRAAVLDVFEEEPLPLGHPMWNTPNLFVTQHSAATSNPKDIAAIFIDNFSRLLNNQTLKFVVDTQSGY